MNALSDFSWPQPLRAVKRAAEDGTLIPRVLYPVEVKALCALVADAPVFNVTREIAPGMTVIGRVESRAGTISESKRAAYFFIARLPNGRIWQCSLYCDWMDSWSFERFAKKQALRPNNIVQALTRIAPEGGER